MFQVPLCFLLNSFVFGAVSSSTVTVVLSLYTLADCLLTVHECFVINEGYFCWDLPLPPQTKRVQYIIGHRHPRGIPKPYALE
jgi:hypothetical protein